MSLRYQSDKAHQVLGRQIGADLKSMKYNFSIPLRNNMSFLN